MTNARLAFGWGQPTSRAAPPPFEDEGFLTRGKVAAEDTKDIDAP